MGYTHYWDHKKNFTLVEWKSLTEDITMILRQAVLEGIALADATGETPLDTKTAIDRDAFSLNGLGEDSYESFYIPRKRSKDDWNFCKTARRPYDCVVTAILCYLTSYYPHRFGASSDGGPDDWEAGLALARRALPHLDNALDIPRYIKWRASFEAEYIPYQEGHYSLGCRAGKPDAKIIINYNTLKLTDISAEAFDEMKKRIEIGIERYKTVKYGGVSGSSTASRKRLCVKVMSLGETRPSWFEA